MEEEGGFKIYSLNNNNNSNTFVLRLGIDQ